jgi:hypothetical protein
MGDYYLRVEAVNLDNFVYDTNDISTIRGGSFLLLDSVNRLAIDNDFKKLLRKISTGASAGLFRIIGSDPDDVQKRVKDYLSNKTDGHTTFVVDTLDGDNRNFKAVQEQLIAKNRWSQWQQLTIPWGKGWEEADLPCTLDGVRPGMVVERFPENKFKKVSSSVKFRRDKGKELRNDIYAHILGKTSCPYEFTRNLEMLSEDKDQGVLNKKIAFIYIDGNKFGRIRDEKCTEEKMLQEFDNSVQKDFREAVLKKLLSHMYGNDASQTADKKVRLETLLWGGDEIEWVVPAWKGWEVLRLFYEFDPNHAYSKIPLTHAAGIVFCHHNAPIIQIRKLAHRLANLAKSNLASIPKLRENGDIFHYLILESFDMLEGCLDSFLKHYYKPIDYKELLLKGQEMQSFSKHMKTVRSDFPRGKVYEIIAALKEKKDVDDIKKRGIQSCPASRKEELKVAIDSLLKDNINRWFVIADLWDFAKEV